MSSSTANVSAAYYKTDGTNWAADPANTTFTITANYGQQVIRQYTDSTMTSGQGSAIVSSNQPLGSVVQILAPSQTPTTEAYDGLLAGAGTFYLPLAMRQLTNANGQIVNSQVAIQNVGGSTITVSVQFLGDAGNYTNPSVSIPSGATYYYDVSAETNLPISWIGSAVVTAASGGQIVTVDCNFAGPDQLQCYNGFPFASVGTSWFVPGFFVRLSNGLSSPVTVQNLSGSQIITGGISLNCLADTGSSPSTLTVTNTTAVDNNKSYAFNPVIDLTSFPTSPWQGFCNVNTGAYNTVAFIQFRKIGTSNAAAFDAINGNSTDKTLVFPLVAKRLGNGFATTAGVQDLNLAIDASVTLTFTHSATDCPSCSDYSMSTTIPAGKSILANMRLDPLVINGTTVPMPDGWQGSLTVVSSNQPIHGYVQMTNILATTGDTMRAHLGFTKP